MELKLDRWQSPQGQLDQGDLHPPTLPQTPTDTSALWEAIEQLDGSVVNNTVKVNLNTLVTCRHSSSGVGCVCDLCRVPCRWRH